jgi:hypothetical protein
MELSVNEQWREAITAAWPRSLAEHRSTQSREKKKRTELEKRPPPRLPDPQSWKIDWLTTIYATEPVKKTAPPSCLFVQEMNWHRVMATSGSLTVIERLKIWFACRDVSCALVGKGVWS